MLSAFLKQFQLDTLEFGVRGGRVPEWVKKVADFFKINPVLSFTSKGIKPVGITYGRKDILTKLKHFVEKKIRF